MGLHVGTAMALPSEICSKAGWTDDLKKQIQLGAGGRELLGKGRTWGSSGGSSEGGCWPQGGLPAKPGQASAAGREWGLLASEAQQRRVSSGSVKVLRWPLRHCYRRVFHADRLKEHANVERNWVHWGQGDLTGLEAIQALWKHSVHDLEARNTLLMKTEIVPIMMLLLLWLLP